MGGSIVIGASKIGVPPVLFYLQMGENPWNIQWGTPRLSWKARILPYHRRGGPRLPATWGAAAGAGSGWGGSKMLGAPKWKCNFWGDKPWKLVWEIGKTCAHVSKKCKKQFVFNMVEIYLWFNLWQPVGDIPLSLSKWCIVEHCKTSEAKQLFSCLGIFQTTPKRNTIFHFVFLLGFNFDTPQWTEAIAAQLLLLELTIENIEKYRCWW